jgi:ataxia telangiectasia mutated family protein
MDRGQAWNEIMKNFTPVFHHFFLERFQNPDTWYNNRIRYTRSVAVSSMIGYVLGIGDRHSMNVLIKNDTAEVVHIDFGITFDQEIGAELVSFCVP